MSSLNLPGAILAHEHSPTSRQRGFSLIVVMLILVVVSVLGVGGIQIAMMAERATRNDRDLQIAWQGAEAALIDAEFDIEGQPASSTTKRNAIFKRGAVDIAKFLADCGDAGAGQSLGLCDLKLTGKPAWLTVDFTVVDNSAKAVPLGAFTGRDFPSGSLGIQPAKSPRYVIEPMLDRFGTRSYRTTDPNGGEGPSYVYRITSMGFGPNDQTQAVLQMIYRN
jgi:type IV pilus assembly protein PilX